jgi:thiamine-monophosphate kinase
MPIMEDILENVMIDRIANRFLRSPQKVNDIHEADAEIINLGNGYRDYLAITTDGLVEEIASGLYDDPYLIGWMLAAVNFSDLAAVGADPLGLLISVSQPPGLSETFIGRLTEGISAACKQLNTFVLGGDTNQGKELFLSGCAVGLVPKKATITRVGVKPGDRVYLSAPGGIGNVFALLRLSPQDFPESELCYQPTARIREGKIVREWANCCMDTSDGVIHTLDTLMRLNSCQFVLDNDWERILHPTALQVCKAQSLPPWLVLAGIHGEFELCFTISGDNEESFLREAARSGWAPILIGETDKGQGISIRNGKRLVPLDSTSIRNLSEIAGSEPGVYIRKLLEIGHNLGI